LKGFTRDHKFVPMTDYKKVTRKSRDSQTKLEGIRLRRDKKIPVYNTKVNWDNKRKPFKMWIVKHPEGSDVVKGSVTIVMAEHYGQAIDDFITIWNKENRMNRNIGYPVVQGTADKNFRYKRDIVRKQRDPAIFDKVHELRQSEFKFEPNTQKNLTTQGSIRFLVDDIQSEIPKKTEIGLAVDLEKSNVSEKLLEEQIKFLEKSAIEMYKFKQVGKTKTVRIKQADRDELHRRIGDRLLMQVASLDSAPSPDFQKRGLTLRKLHQQDASEDEFFGIDKS